MTTLAFVAGILLGGRAGLFLALYIRGMGDAPGGYLTLTVTNDSACERQHLAVRLRANLASATATTAG